MRQNKNAVIYSVLNFVRIVCIFIESSHPLDLFSTVIALY